MGARGFGQALDGLGSARLDLVGNSKFSNATDRPAQRGAREELAQAFGLC
jgi:hypothetical protein